jgi:hypothetical protein
MLAPVAAICFERTASPPGRSLITALAIVLAICVECFANFDSELFGVERFWQEKRSGFATIGRLQRFFEISGDEENFDIGMSRAESVGESPAANMWHHHIGEKQIDFAASVLCEQMASIAAIGCFDDLITKCAQDAHRNVTDAHIIFEKKNGFSSAAHFLTARFFVRR